VAQLLDSGGMLIDIGHCTTRIKLGFDISGVDSHVNVFSKIFESLSM